MPRTASRPIPRSTRLFAIIDHLRRAQAPVPAHALAAALEVTTRTIYRDMASLQALRVPVEGAAGLGYVLRRGFDLPLLMFTDEEIAAIVVGLSLLGRTRDAALQAAAGRVVAKVADVLPEAGSRGDRARPPLYVSSWTAVPDPAVDPAELRDAIQHECKLRLGYADGDGQRSERIIWPLALIYYVDVVVLAAWCEVRRAFRHFRIDRMTRCQPLDERFPGEGQRLREAWAREQAPGRDLRRLP